jgi:hypothetical protein
VHGPIFGPFGIVPEHWILLRFKFRSMRVREEGAQIKQGTPAAERTYFQNCVANNGKVPDGDAQKAPAQDPATK